MPPILGVASRGRFTFGLYGRAFAPRIIFRIVGAILIIAGCGSLRAGSTSAGITNVVLSATTISISGDAEGPVVQIFEVEPFESIGSARTNEPIAVVTNQVHFSVQVPRFGKLRDRAYSSFVAVDGLSKERVFGTN